MAIRQRTARHAKGNRVEETRKPSVAGDRPRNLKVKAILNPTPELDLDAIQAHWISWIRTAFILTCAAALLTLLYWKRASIQVPHRFILPPHDHDDLGPAFTVLDLPGRGKGMTAVRDIRVCFSRCLKIRR